MRRPNIIVILADDLGYSDLGCFGGEIPTPHLDALAAVGVRMNNFYATPRCSPSRASLLTGRYPHDVGIGVLTSDDRPRGYAGSIDPGATTIPEVLARTGYRTGLSGKWHLAADTSRPTGSWPTAKGFEHAWGILAGCGSYYQPRTLRRGTENVDEEVNRPEFFLTDAITDDAITFIKESVSAERPFFLFAAYTAPHWPLHASEADIAAQRGRYAAGWDALRGQRLAKQIELDILPAGTRAAPRDPAEPAWEEEPHQAWQQRRMEVYAAQVTALDRGVGRLVASLEGMKAREDTLVVFLSDNGACAEDLPLSAADTFLNEDICPRRTRAGDPVRVGNDPSILPGAEDTYASYGRAWAGLSNAPLRRYKRWVHEGGIASPLIASWPAGGLREGAIIAEPGQLVDLLPTILDAVANGEPPAGTEGTSILPCWRGRSVETPNERVFCWEHIGNAAIRQGGLKLVRDADSDWELYDLDADRTELCDLAASRPHDVTRLSAAWQQWADRAGVITWEQIVRLYEDRGQSREAAAG